MLPSLAKSSLLITTIKRQTISKKNEAIKKPAFGGWGGLEMLEKERGGEIILFFSYLELRCIVYNLAYEAVLFNIFMEFININA